MKMNWKERAAFVRLGTLVLGTSIAGCSGLSSSQSLPAATALAAHDASAVVKHAGGSVCQYTSSEHFNSKVDIPAGSWLLFTSVFRIPGQAGLLRFQMSKSSISFVANGQTYRIQAPGARISLHSQSALHVHWANGAKHGIWWLMVPSGTMNKDYTDFMDQVAWQVPSPGLSGGDFQGSNEVTWSASFPSGKYSGTQIQWQWGAAVYTQLDNFPPDYNNLGTKPVDDPDYFSPPNSDPAGTPELDTQYLTDGGTNQGGQNDYIGGAGKNHVENITTCGKV